PTRPAGLQRRRPPPGRGDRARPRARDRVLAERRPNRRQSYRRGRQGETGLPRNSWSVEPLSAAIGGVPSQPMPLGEADGGEVTGSFLEIDHAAKLLAEFIGTSHSCS